MTYTLKGGFVYTNNQIIKTNVIIENGIIKGDALSYTIGCASIVAKVYRDNLMVEYAKQYPR